MVSISLLLSVRLLLYSENVIFDVKSSFVFFRINFATFLLFNRLFIIFLANLMAAHSFLSISLSKVKLVECFFKCGVQA